MARRNFHNLVEVRRESNRYRLGQVLRKNVLLKFRPVVTFGFANTTAKLDRFLEGPFLNRLLSPAVTNEVSQLDMLLGCSNVGKGTQADRALVSQHTGSDRVCQFVLKAMHLM